MKTTASCLLSILAVGPLFVSALPQRAHGHNEISHSDRGYHSASSWDSSTAPTSAQSSTANPTSAHTYTTPGASDTLTSLVSSSHPASAATASIAPSVLSQCAASMDGKLPSPTPSDFKWSGNVRRYFVAAEEVNWNYAPTGWDNWLGVPLGNSPRAKAAGYLQHGTSWIKALYRGYTDSSFSEYSEQPSWQGVQGPTLRSEVGDMIEIMFVNKLSTYYVTMHSMGLEYSKYNEGGNYPNNTQPGANVVLPPADAGVPPGECVVYKWLVSDANGPPAGEPAMVHSYHSYVALQQDTDAGLVGPQIVYAPGQMESTMAEYREIPLLYLMFSENDSWLSGANAAHLGAHSKRDSWEVDADNSHLDKRQTADNETVWKPQETNYGGAGQFPGAPNFYAMNGYVFGNNPTFDMCENDKVIWYVNAYGAASHVFHMHGNGFKYQGFDNYAISINDGVGKTLYMDAVDVGKWQVICHVANHQSMGMELMYRVHPTGICPLQPLSGS